MLTMGHGIGGLHLGRLVFFFDLGVSKLGPMDSMTFLYK